MEKDILKKYKKLQPLYSLPKFSDLENAFRLELNDSNQIMSQIRNDMSEKIFSLTERIIEPLIGIGYENFSGVLEQVMVDKSQKMRLFDIYKKVQQLKWENTRLMINSNEKSSAIWIKNTWNLWDKEFESEIKNLCKRMSIAWEKFEISEEKPTYHG